MQYIDNVPKSGHRTFDFFADHRVHPYRLDSIAHRIPDIPRIQVHVLPIVLLLKQGLNPSGVMNARRRCMILVNHLRLPCPPLSACSHRGYYAAGGLPRNLRR